MLEIQNKYLESCWLNLLQQWLEWAQQQIAIRERDTQQLSFDSLLRNVHTSLEHHPALVHLLRQRYPIALIDEFQDTDPLQFAIFQRLFEPLFKPSLEHQHHLTLFLVGDPKQSIYRFRGADLATYWHAKKQAHHVHTLTVNHRSTPQLIDACNRLFNANDLAFGISELHYQTVKSTQRPHAIFNDAKSNAAIQVWHWDEKDAASKKDEFALQCGHACANEIARLLNDAVHNDAAHIARNDANNVVHNEARNQALNKAFNEKLFEAKSGRTSIGGRPLMPNDIAVLVATHQQGSLIKQCLAQRNIGCAELSKASIFSSDEAQSLEWILRAIETPQDIQRVTLALTTELIGLDAQSIFHSSQSHSKEYAELLDWIKRFQQYKDVWRLKGFAAMSMTMMYELNIASRLASLHDGERKLTNLYHLIELLQQQAQQLTSNKSLLRWFSKKRQECLEKETHETEQLRLESDSQLVQILTIHKSKGLEFPIVFCPFVWDDKLVKKNTFPYEPWIYHDAAGQTYLDYDRQNPNAQENALCEIAEEKIRQLYVALTRAVYRCYVIIQTHQKAASKSLINWIAAEQGHSAGQRQELDQAQKQNPQHNQQRDQQQEKNSDQAQEQTKDPTQNNEKTLTLNSTLQLTLKEWLKQDTDRSKEILAAWEALANEHFHITALNASDLIFQSMHSNTTEHEPQLSPRHVTKFPKESWSLYSFSSLYKTHSSDIELTQKFSFEEKQETEFKSNDINHTNDKSDTNNKNENDILNFPRGKIAGQCLHRLFETSDLSDSNTWSYAIELVLAEFATQLFYSSASSIQTSTTPTAASTSTSSQAFIQTTLQTTQQTPMPMQNTVHTQWHSMMRNVLEQVTTTELLPGLTLGLTSPKHWFKELEFFYPVQHCTYASIEALLKQHNYAVPQSNLYQLNGYMQGVIDGVFMHEQRFWIIDWKSNHLGDAIQNYEQDNLALTMKSFGYSIQLLFYSLAVHRWLKRRLPDYDYTRDFGGCLCLFIRGVRPEWPNAGVVFDKPDIALINGLDSLF